MYGEVLVLWQVSDYPLMHAAVVVDKSMSLVMPAPLPVAELGVRRAVYNSSSF